jgi:hypothetical protein
MYAWVWRHLPGNAPVRAAISLASFLLVVLLLFTVVFPWAEGVLPFLDVTVKGNAASLGSGAHLMGAVAP